MQEQLPRGSFFLNLMAVTHSQGEDRFIGIGKTTQGRSVFIAFTLRTHSDDVLIRPISARYMHQKEVEHYEKETSKT